MVTRKLLRTLPALGLLMAAALLPGAAVSRAAAAADPPERPELLKPGTAAPDFTVEAPGGDKVSLAKYKGQVVVLDFWATWCPPCQRSMPHLEKIYQGAKDQQVAVLAVCVFDQKSAYDKWLPENQAKYHYTLAYDPAGRTPDSIAAKLYNVSAIPTTYIIDKDGKVADTVLGFSGDKDDRIEKALAKLDVKVGEKTASAK